MSNSFSTWSDVKANAQALDSRTGEEQNVGKATARERREAYVRGHQLAEMRTMAGVTQAELAEALGVSQARISKIEHGEISGIDIVRAYVAALGGSIDMIARLGDRSWKGSLTRGRLFAQRHVLAKGAPSAGPAPGSAPALCR